MTALTPESVDRRIRDAQVAILNDAAAVLTQHPHLNPATYLTAWADRLRQLNGTDDGQVDA